MPIAYLSSQIPWRRLYRPGKEYAIAGNGRNPVRVLVTGTGSCAHILLSRKDVCRDRLRLRIPAAVQHVENGLSRASNKEVALSLQGVLDKELNRSIMISGGSDLEARLTHGKMPLNTVKPKLTLDALAKALKMLADNTENEHPVYEQIAAKSLKTGNLRNELAETELYLRRNTGLLDPRLEHDCKAAAAQCRKMLETSDFTTVEQIMEIARDDAMAREVILGCGHRMRSESALKLAQGLRARMPTGPVQLKCGAGGACSYVLDDDELVELLGKYYRDFTAMYHVYRKIQCKHI